MIIKSDEELIQAIMDYKIVSDGEVVMIHADVTFDPEYFKNIILKPISDRIDEIIVNGDPSVKQEPKGFLNWDWT